MCVGGGEYVEKTIPHQGDVVERNMEPIMNRKKAVRRDPRWQERASENGEKEEIKARSFMTLKPS